MNRPAVVTSDDRAVAIRDRVLSLVRQYGVLQIQRDSVRLTELRMGVWAFQLWTPFNTLGRDEASSPGYRHAVERQRSRRELPYGLDVYHGTTKVLRMLWSDGGTIAVMRFIRGQWEDEALLL